MVPDVAVTWPVFDDDASAKTRLHDANSDWMEFSERIPNHLSGCSSRPVTPKIFVSGQLRYSKSEGSALMLPFARNEEAKIERKGSEIPLEKLYANLLLATDMVDAAALKVLVLAVHIIIEAYKGQVETAEAELLQESYRVALAFKPRPKRVFRLNDRGRYERATIYGFE